MSKFIYTLFILASGSLSAQFSSQSYIVTKLFSKKFSKFNQSQFSDLCYKESKNIQTRIDEAVAYREAKGSFLIKTQSFVKSDIVWKFGFPLKVKMKVCEANFTAENPMIGFEEAITLDIEGKNSQLECEGLKKSLLRQKFIVWANIENTARKKCKLRYIKLSYLSE
jgi:hypothetical protein